jgi:hypothetical protein
MPVFGFLELENTVQVNDKTRLNAGKSFASKGSPAISLIRIKPESTESFIQVSGTGITQKDWLLDWQYQTSGTKTVELEITLTGGSPQVFTKTISVITAADDKLWSSDQDLVAKEHDILQWVPAGRNTFLNVHREAQKKILNWLDEIRVWKYDGTKLTKTDLNYTDDLKELSINWTLALIFGSIYNKPDDVYYQKMENYMSAVESCKLRGRIQADFNNSGALESTDNQDMRSLRMVRR